MKCSSSGKCVCGDKWSDLNRVAEDGCENYDPSYKMDDAQCESEPGRLSQGPGLGTQRDMLFPKTPTSPFYPTQTRDVEGIFDSDKADIVMVPSQNGMKFSFSFNFNWEMMGDGFRQSSSARPLGAQMSDVYSYSADNGPSSSDSNFLLSILYKKLKSI